MSKSFSSGSCIMPMYWGWSIFQKNATNGKWPCSVWFSSSYSVVTFLQRTWWSGRSSRIVCRTSLMCATSTQTGTRWLRPVKRPPKPSEVLLKNQIRHLAFFHLLFYFWIFLLLKLLLLTCRSTKNKSTNSIFLF